MSEKKREQAERLYEAMSGIDPELLARSEKVNQSEKKIIPFYRYAKVCAACLAFLIIGGACYATLTNGGKKSATNDVESHTADKAATAESNGVSKNRGKKAEDAAGAEADAYEYSRDEVAYEMVDGESCEEMEATPSACQEMIPSNQLNGAEEGSQRDQTQNKTELSADKLMAYGINGVKALDDASKAYLANKRMEIDFGSGGKTLLKNEKVAAQIYNYFTKVEKEPAEDQQFRDYLTILIYDENDSMTDSFTVSGKYLKLKGLPDTYQILDPEFEYAELKQGLWDLTQEEE